MDNFVESPFPTDLVYYKMKDYFKVEDRNGMLDHFYNDFNKRHFAGFTGVLAELTVKNNDRLAQWCIAEAGRKLAHHLIAIQKKIPEEMKLEAGGIKGTIIRRFRKIYFAATNQFFIERNRLTHFFRNYFLAHSECPQTEDHPNGILVAPNKFVIGLFFFQMSFRNRLTNHEFV